MARSRPIHALVKIYVVGNPTDTPWDFVVRVLDRRGALAQEQSLQLVAGVIASVELTVQDESNAILLGGPDTLSAAQMLAPGAN
jgi:hypothetical protein